MVSTKATTGATNNFDDSQLNYFERVRALDLITPRLVGFGISNKTSFGLACDYSNGAIIGSAFIQSLHEHGSLTENIQRFLDKIRN
jgi:tryptophan synthase alpha chain